MGSAWASADAAFSAAVQRKNWSEALTVVDRQLREAPTDPELLMRRAVVLGQLGKGTEGIALLRKTIAAGHDTMAAHNNLAVLLAADGRHEEARRSLELALRAEPAPAVAYDNLSQVSAQLAAEAYRRALYPEQKGAAAMPALALLLSGSRIAQATAPQTPAAPPAVAAAPRTPAPAPAAAPAPPAPRPVTAVAPAAPGATQSAPASPPTPVASAAEPPATAARAPAEPARAAAPSSDADDVRAALQGWAAAWSRREMEAYVGAYVPEFRGSSASNEAWKQERTARIVSKASIEVTLTDIKASVSEGRAVVSFAQTYQADGKSLRSRKQMVLKRVGQRWLIAEESSL